MSTGKAERVGNSFHDHLGGDGPRAISSKA